MSTSHQRFNTRAGRAFDVLNVALLTGVGLLAILPFLYVLAGSFATELEITTRPFFLWPEEITTSSYRSILSSDVFVRAFATTVVVTFVGTLVQLGLTALMAYPLAKADLPGRRTVLALVVFTMVFSAGMIPTFLVVKDLGLLDTYWALILPMAINPFSLIIIKNFFQQLPPELEESAKIDGANELQVLRHVVLPLSKPVLATFALFYAVGIWNDYLSPLLYLSDTSKWTLQMILRQVTAAASLSADEMATDVPPPAQGIKFAVVVIATIPVLLAYPFLQKHFAKGMLIGSVKG
ncbi:carbohydrate ABC transporter membrane protein 2, CUT1 family [Glycomyces sambucus]|uniref:Carbohydrate ABC transporter membrane protein 2, CUT1 family n=1 Tax=Glycomyces sambucus TaxID=380244 RepID=A0A1G9DBR5_9ACTN|nr:carbohydrate ABC transporter permease [Glycomyces sambucus]SDK61336.1 carbohydrate ABC transporter membrane protein 2, CUT1 family [Glycomyces sambucus]